MTRPLPARRAAAPFSPPRFTHFFPNPTPMQRFFFAGLALALAPALASAGVTIDEFNDPEVILFDFANDGVAVSQENLAPSSAFNTRFISVNKMTGEGGLPVIAATGGVTGTGQFNFAETGNTSGSFLIGYDGTLDQMFDMGAAADLDIDFTAQGETGIEIFAASDLGASLVLSVFSDGLQSMADLLVPATGGAGILERFFVPFSDFMGGADFTAVDAFSVSFAADSQIGDDISIDSISTAGAPVPEPASVALFVLLGTGMAGGAARRRRKDAAV